METSAGIEIEYFRYLDFAENQHLQALGNLCQHAEDLDLYAQLLAHKGEVAELIKRRRTSCAAADGVQATEP